TWEAIAESELSPEEIQQIAEEGAGKPVAQIIKLGKRSAAKAKARQRKRKERAQADAGGECIKRLEHLLNVRVRKLIRQGHVPDPDACEAILDKLLEAIKAA